MESNRHGLSRAEIKYARNGGVAIAYQVVGEGDVDLVYVPDWVSNLVYGWEYPPWRDFYLRLARSFRLILFDKRGTGLSDHGGQFATLETRMEDLHAVLDAAGSSRPVIFGAHEGSGMAVLFAASYLERTRALVLFHAVATWEEPATQEDMARLSSDNRVVAGQQVAPGAIADPCSVIGRTDDVGEHDGGQYALRDGRSFFTGDEPLDLVSDVE